MVALAVEPESAWLTGEPGSPSESPAPLSSCLKRGRRRSSPAEVRWGPTEEFVVDVRSCRATHPCHPERSFHTRSCPLRELNSHRPDHHVPVSNRPSTQATLSNLCPHSMIACAPGSHRPQSQTCF